ncbi:MAG TPA: acyloxyacyl hydrolase [Ideonella sp.]|nr:acyloxyacyl hydrolase [Ideonella sp.]
MTNQHNNFASSFILCACLLVGAGPAAAQAGLLTPSAVFVQGGVAETASALVVGANWDWDWQRPTGWGTWSGYWEASFGRWSTERIDGSTSHDWVTQLGITPVLRLSPAGGGGWFVEGGIGVNLLLPIFRAKDKRFSTVFNFGDHLAVGRRFGERGEHEVALRVQHFSNGGIKKPNPGEDFLQLRYTRRWL